MAAGPPISTTGFAMIASTVGGVLFATRYARSNAVLPQRAGFHGRRTARLGTILVNFRRT
jgi:hypothetical protein